MAEDKIVDKTSQADDGLNTSMIVVVGAIIVVLVFAIIIGVQALFFKVQDNENNRKYVSQPPVEFSTLKTEQEELLNGYHWISQPQGVVGIPIDRAMQIIIKECAIGTCEKTGK